MNFLNQKNTNCMLMQPANSKLVKISWLVIFDPKVSLPDVPHTNAVLSKDTINTIL